MIGEKLRNLRKNAGMTQADLAKKIGMSPSAIGMYEQGRREPDSEILVKFSKIFNVSVDFLVGIEKKKHSKKKLVKIDELAKKIEKILRKSGKKSAKSNEIDDLTIEKIVKAVKDGIEQSLKED